MSTFAQVITRARATFPDMSSARALGYAKTAHSRIMERLNIRHTSKTINITDGTKTYDLGAEVGRIYAVIYALSDTDARVLTFTSYDEKDLKDPEWRISTQEGDPEEFLIQSTITTPTRSDKAQITFIPTPGTTTSGGYPIVTIYYSDKSEVTADTMTLPVTLLDEELYVNAICMLYAKDSAKQHYEWHKNLYEEDVQRCLNAYKQQASNEPTEIAYGFYRGRRSV